MDRMIAHHVLLLQRSATQIAIIILYNHNALMTGQVNHSQLIGHELWFLMQSTRSQSMKIALKKKSMAQRFRLSKMAPINVTNSSSS